MSEIVWDDESDSDEPMGGVQDQQGEGEPHEQQVDLDLEEMKVAERPHDHYAHAHYLSVLQKAATRGTALTDEARDTDQEAHTGMGVAQGKDIRGRLIAARRAMADSLCIPPMRPEQFVPWIVSAAASGGEGSSTAGMEDGGNGPIGGVAAAARIVDTAMWQGAGPGVAEAAAMVAAIADPSNAADVESARIVLGKLAQCVQAHPRVFGTVLARRVALERAVLDTVSDDDAAGLETQDAILTKVSEEAITEAGLCSVGSARAFVRDYNPDAAGDADMESDDEESDPVAIAGTDGGKEEAKSAATSLGDTLGPRFLAAREIRDERLLRIKAIEAAGAQKKGHLSDAFIDAETARGGVHCAAGSAFELAVGDDPCREDLWLRYVSFARWHSCDRRVVGKKGCTDLYSCHELTARAVRCVPGSADLWTEHVHAMERLERNDPSVDPTSDDPLPRTKEAALSASDRAFSPEALLAARLTHIEALRRLLMFSDPKVRASPDGLESQHAAESIRRAYDAAVRDTAHHDTQCTVLRHRAATEAQTFRHPVRFLEVCDRVLETCGYRWDIVAELQGLAMGMLSERAWAAADGTDDVDIIARVRYTLARGSGVPPGVAGALATKTGTVTVVDPDPAASGTDDASAAYLSRQWITWERTHGTDADLAAAEAMTAQIMTRQARAIAETQRQERRDEKRNAFRDGGRGGASGHQGRGGGDKGGKRGAKGSKDKGGKGKGKGGKGGKAGKGKGNEREKGNDKGKGGKGKRSRRDDDHGGDGNNNNTTDNKATKRPRRDDHRSNDADAAKQAEESGVASSGTVTDAEPAEGVKTVFVAGFPRKGGRDDILNLLKPCGQITGARFTDRAGYYRGWGYVDFAEAEAVARAEALNGTEFQGKKIKVARSDPSKAEGRQGKKTAASSSSNDNAGAATSKMGDAGGKKLPSFVPRAVGMRRPPTLGVRTTSAATGAAAKSDQEAKGGDSGKGKEQLGNDDFRRMFLESAGKKAE